MLYAQVVFGLPVEGPFDYAVPGPMRRAIKPGARVRVGFRTLTKVAFVVGLRRTTAIAHPKPILELIDQAPIISPALLSLTREVAGHYCCSWGEAIETALPAGIRTGKQSPASIGQAEPLQRNRTAPENLLIHDESSGGRWETYLSEIALALEAGTQTLVIMPDVPSIERARRIVAEKFSVPCGVLYRQQPQESKQWALAREGAYRILIGTRSAVFAPLERLGLIIVDDEHDDAYKQDQVPHYHAREVALMHGALRRSKVILGSHSPSLESLQRCRKGRMRLAHIARSRAYPEIKLIDMRTFLSFKVKNPLISKYLEDSVTRTLAEKGKTLFFLNRTGFATFASCVSCGLVLKCPRCGINLVLHYKENVLRCHHCSYKLEPPKSCPRCNTNHIRYTGSGTEKMESELARFFPQASGTDITIASESPLRHETQIFDLVGVLSIDNSLNRVDFRSTEKTYALLAHLACLTEKKMVIQTKVPTNYCFQALVKGDSQAFYDREFKERSSLGFPPSQRLGLVKLRDRQENRARQAAEELYERLKTENKNRSIKVFSVTPGYPPQLRGNFYWQVVLKARSAQTLTAFLKKSLKDFRHSGIIVTVDIDPL